VGLSLAGILCKEDLSIFESEKTLFSVDNIIEHKLCEIGIKYTSVCRVKQEHTDIVVVLDSSLEFDKEVLSHTVADGIITNLPGIVLVISVADCVPIFLFDSRKKVLGLIHAGREGTRKKVVVNALKEFFTRFNSSPDDIFALIGPSIGPCCYQVSDEIAIQCLIDGLYISQGNKVDLWFSNLTQIKKQGIPHHNIFLTSECTCCSNSYYSYRGGDKIARNYAVGMI